MIKIMFVCTGNICRSPMAHYYMQKRVKDLNIENNFLISSCGVYACTGEKATQNAIFVMKEYNVDMENHRATNIADTNIEDYDYIITLTARHKEQIRYYYPKLGDNIYTLREFVDKDEIYKNIDDPWGLNITVYKDCAQEIVEKVDKLIEKLRGCE